MVDGRTDSPLCKEFLDSFGSLDFLVEDQNFLRAPWSLAIRTATGTRMLARATTRARASVGSGSPWHPRPRHSSGALHRLAETARQRLVLLLFVWQQINPYVDQIEGRNHSVTGSLVVTILEDYWSECRNQESL